MIPMRFSRPSAIAFTRLLAAATALTLLMAAVTPARAQDATESAMARIGRTKVLRVGAIAGAIPYFSKDIATGKWEGFGPDFAEDLAKKLGARVEYVETTWGNSVLDVQTNKVDLMFGLAPTPQRREVVAFSDTLFENTYTAVCKAGFPQKTWEQLNSRETKIVVDVGSSHDQLATRILPKAEVIRLENSGAATMSLQTGHADCQILVILLAEPLLAKRPGLGTMYIPQPPYTAPVGIGLRKETDTGFQKAVNAWLAEARSRGAVRAVILRNMQKLAGVPPEAFPAEVKF